MKGTKIYNALGHPLFVTVIGLRGVQFGEWSAIRSVTIRVITKSDDHVIYREHDYRPIGRYEDGNQGCDWLI